MRFQVLATDFDGTLARNSHVEDETLLALARLRASGRCAFLVTGRTVEGLKLIFSRCDAFDGIVAENGAVLYEPCGDKVSILCESPPDFFAHELRTRGVSPLSVGHVIIASQVPNDTIIVDVIKKLGLKLEIIFNKGAVMVLPSGVNKAFGLDAALRQKGLRPETTVGIGDAENDHAFLSICDGRVAVGNALTSLKEQADFVTTGSYGAGVAELIDRLIASDLEGMVPCRQAAVR